MNKFAKKLATGVVSATVAMMSFVPMVFGANLEIIDNGVGSDNTIVVTNSSSCTVSQKANTNVDALIGASASTGGNTANGNTGGTVGITTGDANAASTMTVTGGNNSATDPCCCTPLAVPPTTEISGNGVNSTNNIVVANTKDTTVRQRARTRVSALVKAKAKTGKNTANGNTGAGTTVSTGVSTSTSDLTVTGGLNTLN
ncbi:MAG: Mucin-like protein [Candidatus Woesebacteria bacterium GW2011_GWA1_33_30]|uniref:Mucin-like protein n=1 Tax=Candidatus Woesebacteria bacterium GW2011_GWA2_33_28 TaxID=1618561 RepID=A0A0G0CXZ7_9BACT|nr:MAG: Mucin-like protein [Candidatus Woesebacteria bacterium GW2011_GWA2_33_28]KKP49014.1 MAG: Mucin-like protein [Candidatus Woesebacteria bacterium GW2011_GWA1_33_30]KKP49878.1 MAG: Mucin-like protein [Microgenomates group bacterium GW2011_GWC1_33_32]KKP52606.1 MAG: Mucin-like protein [Candidatus Woesebacteria bacterium GW2011_GWB1_33_38]KKP56265.1 MAG: Mucin-like protein [Microgenomates group bacterium GW2011_GWD1_33_9]